MSMLSFEPDSYSGHTSDWAKRTRYSGCLVTGSLNATWSGSGDRPCDRTAHQSVILMLIIGLIGKVLVLASALSMGVSVQEATC